MTPEIFFIAPHPLAFTSGGNRYNTQLIGALRLSGWKVRRFSPTDPEIKKTPPGSLFVVDLIYRDALLEGGFELPPHSRWAALVHYLPELDRPGIYADPSWASLFDLLLFPSEFLRRRFGDLYPDSTAAAFVLPPILTNLFWPEAALEPATETKLVVAGNYLPVKGILEFLEQLAQVLDPGPPFTIEVFGSILDKAYWRACQEVVEESPSLCHRVILNAAISRSRLLATLSDASALVSPSSFESFGMAIAEAMCLKRPVLALSGGNVPYLVSSYPGAKLFDQMGTLAFCTKELIQNPSIAKEYYANVRKAPFDSRPFSPDQVIRQWDWIMDHFW